MKRRRLVGSYQIVDDRKNSGYYLLVQLVEHKDVSTGAVSRYPYELSRAKRVGNLLNRHSLEKSLRI
jgi:hypothetical protein